MITLLFYAVTVAMKVPFIITVSFQITVFIFKLNENEQSCFLEICSINVFIIWPAFNFSQLFKGKFYHCKDSDYPTVVTKDECQQLGLTWENKEYNFDNLARVRFIPRILVCLFVSFFLWVVYMLVMK